VSRTLEGNKAHGRIGCCSGWQRPGSSTDSSAEQGLEDGCSSGRIGKTGPWQRGSVGTVTTERQARSASRRFGAWKFALGLGRAARLGVPTGALDGRFDDREIRWTRPALRRGTGPHGGDWALRSSVGRLPSCGVALFGEQTDESAACGSFLRSRGKRPGMEGGFGLRNARETPGDVWVHFGAPEHCRCRYPASRYSGSADAVRPSRGSEQCPCGRSASSEVGAPRT
jgi:hypothetical protein